MVNVERERASPLQGKMNGSKREGYPTSTSIAAIYAEILSLPLVELVDHVPFASGNL